ncbi:MAG TPA: glycosyltransferase, partial [Anaerolineae bacterium]|nr:glycosyltransferase [Anaerolineae bacterium]
IDSLLRQHFQDWGLMIVDDGSPDDTASMVQPYLADERIRYHRLDENQGTGAAINVALDLTGAPYVAYLPSDDVYYAEHLGSLVDLLESSPDAVLAFSGVRHSYNRSAPGRIDGKALQMVQVLHRRTPDRWLERHELVTDDLDMMFWTCLRPKGTFAGTGQVSAEWVAHAGQLHHVIQEPIGGINTYRSRFQVNHPLRFHSTEGNFTDEVAHYRQFRERPDTPMAPDGLKILLLGELAYNAERVLALEEKGHKLYGLWMPDPYWYNNVGPVPFGHVEDLPRDNWRQAIDQVQPDVIYALLNWQAVPFVHEVLHAVPHVPAAWHFKEGPFICLEKGSWGQLVDIHRRADGQIFCSEEMRDWYETSIPGITRQGPTLILDGDLPKREWFAGERSPRLSDQDGELHTVVPGRPIGLHPHNVQELADQGIHLHFYGNFTQKQWVTWLDKTLHLAPNHLHLHNQADQDRWVAEFSQYDAGWLHWQKSDNGGDIARSDWDDLNLPARLTTLVAAGLPVLQYDNQGAAVATQTVGRQFDISIFFSSMEELRRQLSDRRRMAELHDNVWRQRQHFTFDYHVDRLVEFFRDVINRR